MFLPKLTSRSGRFCSLVALLVVATGCTTLVDEVTDSAFDETEGRKIKSDYRRHYNNEPLKYHRSEGDLRRHAVRERFEDSGFEDPWLDDDDR